MKSIFDYLTEGVRVLKQTPKVQDIEGKYVFSEYIDGLHKVTDRFRLIIANSGKVKFETALIITPIDDNGREGKGRTEISNFSVDSVEKAQWMLDKLFKTGEWKISE